MEVITMTERSETPRACPCEAVEQLIALVNQHDEKLTKHEERLGRGNVDFAVISTKLNIIMAILGAVGVAVCGTIISIIV